MEELATIDSVDLFSTVGAPAGHSYYVTFDDFIDGFIFGLLGFYRRG